MTETYELNRFCLDSDCGGVAEPEEEPQGGTVLRYWVCRKCQMEFGHELVENPAAPGNDGGACSLGIPEGVRRAASVAPRQGVFLGSTISRRPE